MGGAKVAKIAVTLEDRASTGLRSLTGELDKFSLNTKITSNNIGSFAKAGGVAFAGMSVAAAAAAGVAIKAASDAAETHSKFMTVYKGHEEVAKKTVDELRAGYAMSRSEAEGHLAAMQDLLVPLGVASDEAANLSGEVVKLSADLGSFNNLDTSQVMGDIQSALVGNYETMKKYGVVLNATTVEEKALAMGLAGTKGELNAAHKAQAAYQMIVEGSSAAVGDMNRTQGSFANQLKQSEARISEITVALGNQLLPVATEYLGLANEWLVANQDLIEQNVADIVDGLSTALSGAIPVAKTFLTGIYALATAADVAGSSIGNVAAAISLAMEGNVKAAWATLQNPPDLGAKFEGLEARVSSLWDPAPIKKNQQEVVKGADKTADGVIKAADKAAKGETTAAVTGQKLKQSQILKIQEEAARKAEQVLGGKIEELEARIASLEETLKQAGQSVSNTMDDVEQSNSDSVVKMKSDWTDYLNFFGDVMDGVNGISGDTWKAIAETAKTGMEEAAASFPDIIGSELANVDLGAVSARAGAGIAVAGQVAKSTGMNREASNASKIAAGAAMGFASGGPWGAAAGAVMGAASGEYGAGPNSGAFGEHGLGQRGDIQNDPFGAFEKGIALVNEAMRRGNAHVTEYVMRQITEVTTGYQELLDGLSGGNEQLRETFFAVADGVHHVAGVIHEFGIDSNEAADAMNILSGNATDAALQLALHGEAGSRSAQAMTALAVSLNRDGVELRDNIAAYRDMIGALSEVDARTRGLTNASETQALAMDILSTATMHDAGTIQAASAASKELTDIQTHQADIAQKLADANNMSTEEVVALQEEMLRLNNRAVEIEENLSGMAGSTADAGEAAGDTGEAARLAIDPMSKFGDSSEIAGGQAKIAADQVWQLKDAINQLESKRISVAVEAETGSPVPGRATGETYVPFDGALRSLHKGESILNRGDAEAYRALKDSGAWDSIRRGTLGGDGVSIGSIVINPAAGMNEQQVADAVVNRLRDLSRRGVKVVDERGVSSGVV